MGLPIFVVNDYHLFFFGNKRLQYLRYILYQGVVPAPINPCYRNIELTRFRARDFPPRLLGPHNHFN